MTDKQWIKKYEKEIKQHVKSMNAPFDLDAKLNVYANIGTYSQLICSLSNINRCYSSITYCYTNKWVYNDAKYIGNERRVAKMVLAKHYGVKSLRESSIENMTNVSPMVDKLAPLLQNGMIFSFIEDGIYCTGSRIVDKITFTRSLMEILFEKRPELKVAFVVNSNEILEEICEYIKGKNVKDPKKIKLNIMRNSEPVFDIYEYDPSEKSFRATNGDTKQLRGYTDFPRI